jgi:hypothetical protein
MWLHNNHYVTDEIVICDKCQELVTKCAIYAEKWQKRRGMEVTLMCEGCAQKWKTAATMEVYRMVSIVRKIPAGAVPVLTAFPGLVPRGDSTVWSMPQEHHGERVVDNTRLAGRQSLEGARIGAEVKEPELLKGQAEVRGFLDGLRDAELLLPDGDTKKIEAKPAKAGK